MSEQPQLHSKIYPRIDDIPAQLWHELFDSSYPFTRHEYLSALESSGSVCSATGWTPCHIVLYAQQTAVAAMPCYLKTHSYGEYIFDWSWAEAYERAGLDYYPKLLCAIPFTPATGPRLGIRQQTLFTTNELLSAIDQTLRQLCQSTTSSNCQWLFVEKSLHQQLDQKRWLTRHDVQFHWFNRDYQDFADFTQTMTARKRKNINKERQQVIQSEIELRVVAGEHIDDRLWQHFYRFYQLTYLKRSRHGGYLNQDFFTTIGRTMAPFIHMVVAEKHQEIVAAALFFKSNDSLYGRYWGCSEAYKFLHFECCYYQGIDYCITHRLKRFDAGAQGEHKLQRGFEPVTTLANYHIPEGPFQGAIARYLVQEKAHLAQYARDAVAQLPYKK